MSDDRDRDRDHGGGSWSPTQNRWHASEPLPIVAALAEYLSQDRGAVVVGAKGTGALEFVSAGIATATTTAAAAASTASASRRRSITRTGTTQNAPFPAVCSFSLRAWAEARLSSRPFRLQTLVLLQHSAAADERALFPELDRLHRQLLGHDMLSHKYRRPRCGEENRWCADFALAGLSLSHYHFPLLASRLSHCIRGAETTSRSS